MMSKTTITMQVEHFDGLLKQIRQLEDGGKKAVKNTVNDMKARAPSWVAAAVTLKYNISKKEIIPGSVRKGKNGEKLAVKQAGKIRITGETIESFQMVYEGRMLTPVHFGMTPKAPPQGRNYTLKMQVIKGQKKVIGRYLNTRTPGGPYSECSHNILMGTGAATSEGVSHIPFQRMSKTRTDLHKFTAISVPQMVDSEEVNEKIIERLNTEAAKRFQHNLDRILSR